MFTYLVAAIPFGLIVAKSKGIDLRTVGSGNIGSTNVYRALGIKYAVIVFILDSIKGAIPTYLAIYFIDNPWVHVAIGAIAIVGHSLSCFVKFKGGKGAATAIGVIIALGPSVSVITILLAIVMIAITRIVSLTTITCSVLTPLLFYIFDYPLEYTLSLAVIAMFIIARHRANIVRLIQNKENKI